MCLTLSDSTDYSTPGLPVHHQLPELAQTHIHLLAMPSNHLILCRPFLLLPSIFPSIRVFSNESVLHIRWPKSWSFSFSISPSNEHPGLISFRMDWLDLLAVQGTLKSLLQHHSSKASILRCSAFFTRTPTKFSHKTSRGCHCHSALGAPACSASRTHPRNSMFLLLLITANKRNSPPTVSFHRQLAPSTKSGAVL